MAAMLVYVLVLRLKLTRFLLVVTILGVGFLSWYMVQDDRYVSYAPHYERTIMQDDFGSKINATTSGEDISAMERVHRWVAGRHMIEAYPMTGVGPANFYETYRPYSVFSFETYVSDNPERSGIHAYFLMLAVEQGVIGLMLLVGLLIIAFVHIEQGYHAHKDSGIRQLYMMIGTTLAGIVMMNTINDLIEVIKVGGIFYFLLSLLLIQRSRSKESV